MNLKSGSDLPSNDSHTGQLAGAPVSGPAGDRWPRRLTPTHRVRSARCRCAVFAAPELNGAKALPEAAFGAVSEGAVYVLLGVRGRDGGGWDKDQDAEVVGIAELARSTASPAR